MKERSPWQTPHEVNKFLINTYKFLININYNLSQKMGEHLTLKAIKQSQTLVNLQEKDLLVAERLKLPTKTNC